MIRVSNNANKTSHFVASWYRPPGSTSEEFHLFRGQLDYIRTHHKGKKLPSVHVLGDFNFEDIDWPARLSKSGSTLSQSEGQILIDIMNDHGLEQMAHFPTREKNTLDLILTPLPGQFQDIHSPDKLSDHDIVSGTLKIFTPQDTDWPDRLSKSGSTLSQSEEQILIDIMNDHGLEQMVHFPTREKNTLDLILTPLPGQFQDIHPLDKLSDHYIVSGTLKIFTPPPPPRPQ